MANFREHLEEVVNKSWNFAGRLDTPEKQLQNALVGLASEAGETLDIGKKQWFHSEKPEGFFREKYLSELGDVAYYWLKAVELLGFTQEEVLAYNKKKLESRHPELGVVTERFGPEAIKG
jgi:hypothetical protein